MPYIQKDLRLKYNAMLAMLRGSMDSFGCVGELNYLITRICGIYANKKGVSYTTLNEIVGVLECVKLELARRKLSPYEEEKCKTNGDVYND
jgi:hypothetical protein